MSEQELEGGNAGGAVRVGATVRRATEPWTPSVHGVLQHLDRVGFGQAPKPLGIDEQGREVLSFLPGNTVGTTRPWPAWVHSDEALIHVAHWLRNYHTAVADFVPPDDAVWREGRYGDPVYQRMLEAGVADSLRTAAAELERDTDGFVTPSR